MDALKIRPAEPPSAVRRPPPAARRPPSAVHETKNQLKIETGDFVKSMLPPRRQPSFLDFSDVKIVILVTLNGEEVEEEDVFFF